MLEGELLGSPQQTSEDDTDPIAELALMGTLGAIQASYLADAETAQKNFELNYWAIYDIGEGPQVAGFPSLRVQELFTRETRLGATGEFYLRRDLPAGTSKQELRAGSFDIQLPGDLSKEKEHYRAQNKALHELLSNDVSVVDLYDSATIADNLEHVLPNGFVLYESEWGESFVPINAGSVTTVTRIDQREDCSILFLQSEHYHKENGPLQSYNYGAIQLSEGEVAMGIISSNSKPVGIYFQETPFDTQGFVTAQDPFKYHVLGQRKRVLLSADVALLK